MFTIPKAPPAPHFLYGQPIECCFLGGPYDGSTRQLKGVECGYPETIDFVAMDGPASRAAGRFVGQKPATYRRVAGGPAYRHEE